MSREPRSTVVVVEDDAGLRSGLRLLLSRHYEVWDTAYGEQALERIRSPEPVDLVVLDLMLPDLTGESVLTEIRRTHPELPVLVLSARSQVRDKVDLLEGGADDYLSKPFANEELEARIRVLIGRRSPASFSISRWGDLSIDLTRKLVTHDGATVTLSKTQFAILAALIERPGHVLSREQILDRVWGLDAPESSRIVDYHVLQIRRRLAPVEVLITVPGLGYRSLPPSD